MVFRSSIDAWLLVVIVAAAVAVLVAVAFGLRQASGIAALALVAVGGIGAALPLWILADTKYVIDDGVLHIRSGPFAWHIPVASITSITPTTSPASSPALSLQRLRLEYGKGRVVLVSPADPQAFIAAIQERRKGRE
jgi:predicted outer membrane lipoprotein